MKKIVLTFDDGLSSHGEFVIPLLKKYNLTGTFFITNNEWEDESRIDWNLLKVIEEDGFEIANHTYGHRKLTIHNEMFVSNEITQLEKSLIDYGITDMKTFCYPGYHNNTMVQSIVESLGYDFARQGYGEPNGFDDSIIPEDRDEVFYYSIGDNKMTIKSTGIVNENYKLNHFIEDIDNMPEDKIGIFTFHGFTEKVLSDEFKKIIGYIVENDIETIKFRDLPR